MERRKHKRFMVKNGAYTVNSTKPGLIVDIGLGGLSFRYIDRKEWPQETNNLDIVFGDNDFRLTNVPYRVVSDSITDHDFSNDKMVVKRRSVEFGDLSAGQILKLQHFIDRNAMSELTF